MVKTKVTRNITRSGPKIPAAGKLEGGDFLGSMASLNRTLKLIVRRLDFLGSLASLNWTLKLVVRRLQFHRNSRFELETHSKMASTHIAEGHVVHHGDPEPHGVGGHHVGGGNLEEVRLHVEVLGLIFSKRKIRSFYEIAIFCQRVSSSYPEFL